MARVYFNKKMKLFKEGEIFTKRNSEYFFRIINNIKSKRQNLALCYYRLEEREKNGKKGAILYLNKDIQKKMNDFTIGVFLYNTNKEVKIENEDKKIAHIMINKDGVMFHCIIVKTNAIISIGRIKYKMTKYGWKKKLTKNSKRSIKQDNTSRQQ